MRIHSSEEKGLLISKCQKYRLTNVHKYDDINRLTFHIMESLILCPLAKTAYLAIVRIVFDLKCHFVCPMFRSKSKKVKNGLNRMLCYPFCTVLAENHIFANYLPFNWITFEIKMLSRSNPHYEVGFCFCWPLAGSHWVIFKQPTCLSTCQLKRSNWSKITYGKPHYTKLLNFFPSV